MSFRKFRRMYEMDKAVIITVMCLWYIILKQYRLQCEDHQKFGFL